MRKYCNELAFAAFATFAFATVHFSLGVFTDGRLLEVTAELAHASASDSDRLIHALRDIDDERSFRERSGRAIAGKVDILRGIADLLTVLHTNSRFYVIALAVCILGLLISGTSMYLLLRSQARQLAHRDDRAVI